MFRILVSLFGLLPSSDGLRLDARVSPVAVLPLEPIELELRLENESAAAIRNAPKLTLRSPLVSLSLTREGKEIPYGQPVRLAGAEGEVFIHELAAGATDAATFKLAYDWDSKTFPFVKPGSYALTVRISSENGAPIAVSEAARFTVIEPPASRLRELQELDFTEAYPYVFAPGAIPFDPEADAKVERLMAFHRAHPDSGLTADAPFVAAALYYYRAHVTFREEPEKAKAASLQLDAALREYLSAGKGSYLDQARQF